MAQAPAAAEALADLLMDLLMGDVAGDKAGLLARPKSPYLVDPDIRLTIHLLMIINNPIMSAH